MSRIADAVLAYLEAHPEAEDTLDGISNWWLLYEHLPPRDDVLCALEKLVAEGYLVKHDSPDGRCLFRRPHAA